MNRQWQTVALGEVLTLVSRNEKVNPLETYKLLGIRINGNGVYLRETKTGSESSAKELSKVKTGDFIYSRLFAWNGAFDIVKEEFNDYYVSNEFPTFSVNETIIDKRFLLFWFRLSPTLKAVEDKCTGSTPQTRNRFKEKFFFDLKIPLPSLTEQRRIVARIEALAVKVEEVKKLRQEIVEDNYKMLLGVYHKIIENAEYKTMAEVAPLVRRPVEQIDNEKYYPELGVRSFGNGTFHKTAIKGVELGTKRIYEIKPDDLVFSNVFAWEGAIAVAKPEDNNRFGSHRFITCVAKENLALSSFLEFHFLTQKGLEQIGDASPGGAGRNRTLGLTKLEALKVPIPAIEKQRWFDSLLQKTNAIKKHQADTEQQLNALMPAILDQAFKGEL
jgi:type I restriction enzyme S subunit